MWKLKVNEKGEAVLQDGKPVYIKPDGTEVIYDVNQTMQTVTRLGNEARDHRTARETAEAALKAFEGLDPAKAKAALETVGKIDQKKLIDVGEVDKVKAEISKGYEEKIAEGNKKLDAITAKYNNGLIGGAFSRSKFVADKLAIPVDMVQASFGSHFRIENDQIRAYDAANNPIYSKDRIGELATFDEAIEIIVGNYPNKDKILKGAGSSGSGSKGVLPGGGAKTRITRADFDKLSPAEKVTTATSVREGKAEIVDSVA